MVRHPTILSLFSIGVIALAAMLNLPSEAAEKESSERHATEKYIRTELYFGFGKKDGTEVTADEWRKFVDEEVTPRFPEGLTIVEAVGQFRSASGLIVHEKSRMLVLLYKKKEREKLDPAIEAIRKEYCKKFDQESVMRVDLKRSVEVSFEE